MEPITTPSAFDKWFKKEFNNYINKRLQDLIEFSENRYIEPIIEDILMKHVFVVTIGAENQASRNQYAFEDLEDAKFFRADIDKGKGASSNFSTIHVLEVHEKGQY